MTEFSNHTPADQANQALYRMRESLESFLKESSLRTKDLEQGTRLAEEVFKKAGNNIIERQNQIEDQKMEIKELEQSINNTKDSNKELEAFIAVTSSEIKKLDEMIEKQKETITEEQNKIEHLEETTKSVKGEIVSLENEISELKRDLDSIKIEGEKTLASIQNAIEIIEEEINQLKQENAVIDFLIMESSVEIPEVDVLTAVLSESVVTLDLLKKEMGIAPVTVRGTVQKLEAKGIITFSSVDNRITMNK